MPLDKLKRSFKVYLSGAMSWRTSNHDFKYYIGLIPIWNEEKSLKRALEFLKEILHIVYNFDDFQLFLNLTTYYMRWTKKKLFFIILFISITLKIISLSCFYFLKLILRNLFCLGDRLMCAMFLQYKFAPPLLHCFFCNFFVITVWLVCSIYRSVKTLLKTLYIFPAASLITEIKCEFENV